MQKILLADESGEFLKTLCSHPDAIHYKIETAENATTCLEKINSFSPDLLVVDLMLPGMHGIEILKYAKKKGTGGVFILSSNPMIQNYQSALQEGANYILFKPFDPSTLFRLIVQFFIGHLKPAPFEELKTPSEGSFYPSLYSAHSYIHFWGTRGSAPVSGRDYVRYGGNTPCLEVHAQEDMIIIDAGTGIRPLGKVLLNSPSKKLHIFLGHTHWDHIAGFPFFAPMYHPDFEIHIWSPVSYTQSTKDLFNEKLSYSFFPVQLEDIAAKIFFHDLRDNDSVNVGKIQVQCTYAFHPGPTLCFKITVGSQIIGYITDNEFLMNHHGDPKILQRNDPIVQPYERFLSFFKDCTLLIHEAQYTPQEYLEKVGWGHSSSVNAALLVKFLNVREWFMTHHDPQHTDDELLKKFYLQREIVQYLECPTMVRLAYDDLLIPI